MTMRLQDLLAGVATLDVRGDAGAIVAEVRDDSRTVEPGDLFVAVPGLRVDGGTFVADAAQRGAACVVVEGDAPVPFAGTLVRVDHAAAALGRIAANRFGRPASALDLVGVTGTNGKTTTTYLVESVLARAGRSPGVIGTVAYRYAGRTLPSPYTTPTPLELHRLLASMREAGVDIVVMEVSSHALQLGRVEGLSFACAAFTNLTQDHLDLHGSMERYFEAKAALFERHLSPAGTAAICIDGPAGRSLASRCAGRVLRVSTLGDADVLGRTARAGLDGMDVTIETPRGTASLRTALVGDHNLQNLSVAAGVACALGVDAATIGAGLAAVPLVPGRLERVVSRQPFAVLVDYAHTPDALERAIAALRPLCAGRLRVVFGCGGDRDRGKRPRMGEAVARGADVAYVTSDNPRSEDPDAIIAGILDGVRAAGGAPAVVLPDRREAIRTAVRDASAGDVVLIAGKGHEDYQILRERRVHFDDREEARAALEARGLDGAAVAPEAR
jgi:UDP-N-acetylmuramoyl-L-alanyl-D-glutamate--2,6-diaminopimelate ligase